MEARRPVVLLLGPALGAISGVSTHLNLLFASRLAQAFELVHFQAGSQGRAEGRLGKLARLLLSPLALAATIVRKRAAIVHINTVTDRKAYWRDLAYLVVAKAFGARVVYQLHGGALPAQFFEGSALLTRFLRTTLRWPDLVVLLGSAEGAAYAAFVPGQATRVVPNGVDAAVFASPPRQCDGSLRLIYVGRLTDEKGLYETVDALRMARDHGLDARLAVVGDGPERAALERHVGTRGLENDVCFAGPAFGERKLRLLRDADLMVLASHREGLPYALLEAMASGLPSVTTPVGAIPDVITDGVHGLMVPCRDAPAIFRALERFARDPALLCAMGEAARVRVGQAFSVQRLEQDFAAIYAALAARRAPGLRLGLPGGP